MVSPGCNELNQFLKNRDTRDAKINFVLLTESGYMVKGIDKWMNL